MASTIGRTGPALERKLPSLADQLLDSGYRFDFFQAVRLLRAMYAGRKPVGGYEDPAEEVVRFHAHNTLSFPASEVYEVAAPSDVQSGGPAHMWVTFMGMTGPMGALPTHYTATLSDSATRGESAPLAAFLDIFTHRFVSLFYRAWEKYRFPIAYERGDTDTFSDHLFCIIGLGTAGLQQRLSFNDQILLYYSGLLSQRPRSASALAGLLQDYFAVPVHVEQFTGESFLMNPDTLTSLGSQNHQLGVTTVLWQEVFDPQARFRVSIGPLPFAGFRDFLPSEPGYQRLVELTRFFVGDEMNFEVEPLVELDDVPACSLGANSAIRLGWSMWMPTEVYPAHTTQPLFEARVAHNFDREVSTK
jgi:type VI secretion system protein ImpH